MQKWIGFAAVVVAAMALLCQGADAGTRRHHHADHRLGAVSFGVGVGATAGYFALRDWRWSHPRHPKMSSGGAAAITTLGCMAASPIIGTLVVNRPLTYREVYVMSADCLIPFVGGWLMNKAFDAHPEWEGKRPRRH